jgi:hypothetical protein
LYLPPIIKSVRCFAEFYAAIRNYFIFLSGLRYSAFCSSCEPITDDTYLLAAVRYIHNNPLKAGICSREEYPWSSWHEYTGQPDLVTTEIVLSITGGKDGFLELSRSNEDLEGLDISEKTGVSDSEALDIIKKELHLESGTQLQSMGKDERNAAIRLLKEHNLSIRQIARLTGINRGVILKA